MIQLLRKLFDTSKRDVELVQPIVDQINALEPEIEKLSDEELKDRCHQLRHRAMGGVKIDDLVVDSLRRKSVGRDPCSNTRIRRAVS